MLLGIFAPGRFLPFVRCCFFWLNQYFIPDMKMVYSSIHSLALAIAVKIARKNATEHS